MRARVLHLSALAAVLAVAAACATAAPTTGTAADETAIRGIASKYAEHFNARDVTALSAMIAEDWQSVGPDGTIIKGRAAWIENEKQGMTALTGLPLKLDVQTTYVQWLSGASAVAGGTWTMAGMPPGAGADKGAWMGGFKKSADGQWVMSNGLISEYHPQTPPAPTPTPTPGKGK